MFAYTVCAGTRVRRMQILLFYLFYNLCQPLYTFTLVPEIHVCRCAIRVGESVIRVRRHGFCIGLFTVLMMLFVFVARLSKSLVTLTLGSSKINQHCWRFHGSGVIAAPQIIGLISFCTGMHHEYFFEVVNVLSCSPLFNSPQSIGELRNGHVANLQELLSHQTGSKNGVI